MPIDNPDKPHGGHSCWDKAKEIERRLGILLGLQSHSIISEMCKLWGTKDADEFYARMGSMSDDELRASIETAKRNLRKKQGLTLEDRIIEGVYV